MKVKASDNKIVYATVVLHLLEKLISGYNRLMKKIIIFIIWRKNRQTYNMYIKSVRLCTIHFIIKKKWVHPPLFDDRLH